MLSQALSAFYPLCSLLRLQYQAYTLCTGISSIWRYGAVLTTPYWRSGVVLPLLGDQRGGRRRRRRHVEVELGRRRAAMRDELDLAHVVPQPARLVERVRVGVRVRAGVGGLGLLHLLKKKGL